MIDTVLFSDDDDAQNHSEQLVGVKEIIAVSEDVPQIQKSEFSSRKHDPCYHSLLEDLRKPLRDIFTHTLGPAKNLLNPYDIDELSSHEESSPEKTSLSSTDVGRSQCRTPSRRMSRSARRAAQLRMLGSGGSSPASTPSRRKRTKKVAAWKLWSTWDSDEDDEYIPTSVKRSRLTKGDENDVTPNKSRDRDDVVEVIPDKENETPKRQLRKRKVKEKWESDDSMILGDVQDSLRLDIAIEQSVVDFTPSPATSTSSEDSKPLIQFLNRHPRSREREVNISPKSRKRSACPLSKRNNSSINTIPVTSGDVQDNLCIDVAIEQSMVACTPSPATSSSSDDSKPLIDFLTRRSRSRDRNVKIGSPLSDRHTSTSSENRSEDGSVTLPSLSGMSISSKVFNVRNTVNTVPAASPVDSPKVRTFARKLVPCLQKHARRTTPVLPQRTPSRSTPLPRRKRRLMSTSSNSESSPSESSADDFPMSRVHVASPPTPPRQRMTKKRRLIID